MKTRLHAILVGLLSIITLPILSYAYDFEYDGIYYDILSLTDMTCEVKGYRSSSSHYDNIVIPSNISNKSGNFKVVSIGFKAFEKYSTLKSIEIPNSVTSIGRYAFYECI